MSLAKKVRVRKTISLDESDWSKIDEVRFSRRIRREADAIALLINAGYAAIMKKPPSPDGGETAADEDEGG